MDDPQAVIDQAVAAGARKVYPAAEEHGWLLGRIADPFGHHWEIGKPLHPWPQVATTQPAAAKRSAIRAPGPARPRLAVFGCSDP